MRGLLHHFVHKSLSNYTQNSSDTTFLSETWNFHWTSQWRLQNKTAICQSTTEKRKRSIQSCVNWRFSEFTQTDENSGKHYLPPPKKKNSNTRELHTLSKRKHILEHAMNHLNFRLDNWVILSNILGKT